ncbi:MAG: hypothetical protein ACXWQO_08545 [Bdellovibrionota bacterium]
MKNLITAILFTTLISATTSFAGQERGGGDFVGLEATTSAQAALFELSQNQALAQRAHLDELMELLKNVKVVSVTKDLKVSLQGITQFSTAMNERATATIQVNVALWNGLADPRPRKALMLHELESLLGYESTGDYSISGAYLAATGYTKDLPTVIFHTAKSDRPRGFDLTSYGVMDCAFGECTVIVPAYTGQSKATCEKAFKAVYDNLLNTGKIITHTVECGDLAVRQKPNGGPDYEAHSGSFTGRISFQ